MATGKEILSLGSRKKVWVSDGVITQIESVLTASNGEEETSA